MNNCRYPIISIEKPRIVIINYNQCKERSKTKDKRSDDNSQHTNIFQILIECGSLIFNFVGLTQVTIPRHSTSFMCNRKYTNVHNQCYDDGDEKCKNTGSSIKYHVIISTSFNGININTFFSCVRKHSKCSQTVPINQTTQTTTNDLEVVMSE